jgi:hypothetical protein
VYFAKQEEGKFLPGLEPSNKAPHFKVYDHAREFSATLNLITVLQNYKISLSKESKQKFSYKLEVSDDTLTASLIIYDKFSKLIGEKNKAIVVIPAGSDVFNYLKSGKKEIPKFVEYKKNLTDRGWQVIDTMEAFSKLPENEISNYFICDGHWNEKGNALAAEYINKTLVKK